MQHIFAQGMLIIWPLVALVLYMTMPAGRATIWTLLAGYLLLPQGINFDFPGVPALDKSTIPNLAALVLALATARKGEFRWPRSVTLNMLMLGFVLSPFATGMTNGDAIVIGSVVLPSMGFREGLSMAIGHVLVIAPFMLGAGLLANEGGHRQILVALVIGALAYVVPVLLEIRLSPFIQGWVYGISDVDFFLQQMRFGGFRSMVFLGHGLLVSALLAMALLAAIGLAKEKVSIIGIPASLVAAVLAVVLVLNKSVGAIILVVVLAPLLIVFRARTAIKVMAGLAFLVAAYPAVRGADAFPYQRFVEAVGSLSPDRAHSLEYRFQNEEMLLTRAKERSLFGWGSFGRNRVIVVTDWGATVDVTVTDGTWVIVIGTLGWTGYLLFFGLLTYPFLRLFKLRKAALPAATLALAAVHMFNLLDLIPNSSVRPITWLIAGALANLVLVKRNPAEERPTAIAVNARD